jgi:hypothetical protein
MKGPAGTTRGTDELGLCSRGHACQTSAFMMMMMMMMMIYYCLSGAMVLS